MTIYKWLVPLIMLQGCAMTTVVDVGVVAATGKSMGSHALSEYHQQDCDTYRAVKGQDICRKSYYGQVYYKR
jgi:hypothetical protein